MKRLLNVIGDRYGIGREPATEERFYEICEAEGVEVHHSDNKFSFYFAEPSLAIYCIVLPKRRKGVRRLFEMWHELAHHFLASAHEPTVAFNGLLHNKCEAEADAIALVAMMPKDRLNELAFLDGSRYGSKLFNDRMRLYFLYDI